MAKQMQLNDINPEFPAISDKNTTSDHSFEERVEYEGDWSLQDRQVVLFPKYEGFLNYLKFRKETDRWYDVPIHNLCAVPINASPFFMADSAANARYVRNGISHKFLIPIDTTDSKVQECVNEGMFLIGMETERGIEAIPMRYTAEASVLQRAGTYCESQTLKEPKRGTNTVPIEARAEFFNYGKDARSKTTHVLVRDGKIAYAGSEIYQKLCPYKGAMIMELEIRKEHPELTFLTGMASHEYLIGEYALHDELMEESVRIMMEQAGMRIAKVRAGVRYSTSEVGTSAMTCKPFLDYKTDEKDKIWNRIFLPSEVKVEHEGKKGFEIWRGEFKKIGQIFKESEDRLEELGNTPIAHLPETVQAIRATYTFLPAKETQTAIDALCIDHPDGTGTAMDVFVALNQIVQMLFNASDITPTRYINLAEQVQKLINLDYVKIDNTGECPKK